jgi:hypothetical protein
MPAKRLVHMGAPGAFTGARRVSTVFDGNEVAASSGNVATAVASATLKGPTSSLGQHIAFLSGFNITAGGATTGSIVLATVTGVPGGPLTFVIAVPTGATLGITPPNVEFDPPLPESTPGGGITVSLPALGSGNTNAAINAWGFTR